MKRVATPLLLVLLTATLHAQTRVTFGPEVLVTGPFARPTHAIFPHWKAPAFAAGGRDGYYLLAWSEYDATRRIASLVTAKIDAAGGIVPGTRNVAQTLRAYDPDAQFPAVAFDGERFLVAWTEGRTIIPRLLAMRFDRDGRPLDPIPLEITFTSRLSYVAATAGSGEFLVTYGVSSVVPPAAAVARIAADGTVLERDRTLPGATGFWRDIESNGSSMFVVSESASPFQCIGVFCGSTFLRTLSRVPFARSLSLVPPVLDTSGGLLPIGSGLATDGQRYLFVSWGLNDPIAPTGWLLRGQLTDPNGERFIRELLVARDSTLLGVEQAGGRVDAVWTGGSYAIAYAYRDLRLTFVSPTGMTLVDPAAVSSGGESAGSPVVLPIADGRVLVLYERGTPERTEIVARTAGLAIKSRAVR